MRGWVVFVAAIGVFSMTSAAAAQDKGPTSKTDKMESWIFPDDKLLTVPNGSGDMIIRPPSKTVRTILTRPRTQFVPELLKTIESL